MSQLPGPSTAAAAPLSTRTENAIDTLAFHLDYLDDKLTAIGSKYAEDISAVDTMGDSIRGGASEWRRGPLRRPRSGRCALVSVLVGTLVATTGCSSTATPTPTSQSLRTAYPSIGEVRGDKLDGFTN